jgi:hypothetical protein
VLVVSFRARKNFLRVKVLQYPLDKRLNGLRVGLVAVKKRKYLVPAENKMQIPRSSRTEISHYTDWAIAASHFGVSQGIHFLIRASYPAARLIVLSSNYEHQYWLILGLRNDGRKRPKPHYLGIYLEKQRKTMKCISQDSQFPGEIIRGFNVAFNATIYNLIKLILIWSICQSSWLQIQRSRARFPALPVFMRSSGCGTVSTQPCEYKWGAICLEK